MTILINKIIIYSAMKIIANILEPYSILNPDTNSDSPSAKSNGARLVSANIVINHKINNGINRITRGVKTINIFKFKSILIYKIITLIIIKAILISYEIVWATPRNAPNKAYLELDLQPDIKVG